MVNSTTQMAVCNSIVSLRNGDFMSPVEKTTEDIKQTNWKP